MKTNKERLDEVVSDIKSLLERDVVPPTVPLDGKEREGAVADLAVRLANHVDDATDRNVPSSRVRADDVLYFTEIGKPCVRELWYKKHSTIGPETLPYNNIVKFTYGNIVEEMVLSLAELSGHKVTHRQQKVQYETVEFGGIKLSGKIDAFIDDILVDVKGTTAYGFKKFQDHRALENDTFGYGWQLDGYRLSLYNEAVPVTGAQRASTLDGAGFLAIHRDLGHITADYYNQLELPSRDVFSRFSSEVKGKLPAFNDIVPPDRMDGCEVPMGTSGNMVLGTYCSYCSFKRECWGGGLKTYVYSDGPKFFTKVVREPKVEKQA